MLAVLETGVHLDLLVAQGRLARTVTEELISYALPGPGTLTAVPPAQPAGSATVHTCVCI